MRRLSAIIVFLGFVAGGRAQSEVGVRPVSRVAERKEIARQMAKILPVVEFKEATLTECVAWLKAQGVPVELSPTAVKDLADLRAQLGRPEPRVTLARRDVPALKVLQEVTNLTYSRYELAEGKLMVGAVSTNVACSVLREWKVPPTFFGPGGAAKPKAYLEKQGVKFPPGAWTEYNSVQQVLVVKFSKDDEEELDQVDDLVTTFLRK